MKFKKIMCAALAAALTVCSLGNVFGAEKAALKAADAECETGDTAAVVLRAEGAAYGVSNFDVKINYDSDYLKYEGYEKLAYQGMLVVNDKADGEIVISAAGTKNSEGESLLVLNFRAKGAGENNIEAAVSVDVETICYIDDTYNVVKYDAEGIEGVVTINKDENAVSREKASGETEITEETTAESSNSKSGGSSSGSSSKGTTEAVTEEETEADTNETSEVVFETEEETADALEVRVSIGSNILSVNGKEYEVDAAPYIQAESSSTLVPLRVVSLALLGGEVENADSAEAVKWDGASKTATILSDGREISFTAGSNAVVIDGVSKEMDYGVKAEIKDGRMYIPFRALGEALGVEVSWEADTKTAVFTG